MQIRQDTVVGKGHWNQLACSDTLFPHAAAETRKWTDPNNFIMGGVRELRMEVIASFALPTAEHLPFLDALELRSRLRSKETSDTNGRVTATDPVNTAVADLQHEFTQA